MAKFIRHITLQTGHARNSFAGEVSPEALALCLRLLADCLAAAGEKIPIPNFQDFYLIAGDVGGRTLLGSVWHGINNAVPLVNLAVATRSRNAAIAWREMHKFATLASKTDIDEVPMVPWIAVSIEPDLMFYPDAANWLGDFERCLAWAWVDYRNEYNGQ